MWFGALCHVSHVRYAFLGARNASRLSSYSLSWRACRRVRALKHLVAGRNSLSIDYAEGAGTHATATPSCARREGISISLGAGMDFTRPTPFLN